MRSPGPEVDRPVDRRAKALLATASVAVALAAADTYVVVLALQDMMNGVGLGVDALQKATPIISGFLLGYIAVLPLIGRLADLIDRQRILIAIAFACRPRLIVADEPTTALDVTTQNQILYEMQTLCRESGSALVWCGSRTTLP